MTDPRAPSGDHARQLVLRLASLVIAFETFVYVRYLLLFGRANLVEHLGVLCLLGFIFLNLYIGQRWARWILVAIGSWIPLRSIPPLIRASTNLRVGVALLLGLRGAVYLFVAWTLYRSSEVRAFLAAPDGPSSVGLTRLVGVVSYSFVATLIFGAVAHLPFLKACLTPAGCSATTNAVGATLFLLCLLLIIVVGWAGRLPGYGRRSHQRDLSAEKA